jgi:hypothetical protein
MAKKIASQEEKKVSFTELADGLFAYTTGGDPHTGIVTVDPRIWTAPGDAEMWQSLETGQ